MNRHDGRNRRRGRILLILLIIVAIALFGWLIGPYHRPVGKQTATSSPSAPAGRRHGKGKDQTDDSWRGLKTAGIPAPGAWSADKAWPSTPDGKPDHDSQRITLNESYGPLMAALRTINALADRSGSGEQWGLNVAATMGPDGSGESHPAGDAPRYWFAERRFDPARMCNPGDALDGGGISPAPCGAGGTYPGGASAAILVNPYYQSGEVRFPVPSDLRVDSLTDPQDIVRQMYGTVYVPMDDGIWTITTYCPASDPDHLVTVDKNNKETGMPKDAYWPAAEPASAFGTKNRPCRTVEYTVAGQRPFWYVGASNGSRR